MAPNWGLRTRKGDFTRLSAQRTVFRDGGEDFALIRFVVLGGEIGEEVRAKFYS